MGNKSMVRIMLECILVTASKWSLGQGNIFTPVCHSVHRGVLSQHALQVVSQHALQGGLLQGVCSQVRSAPGGMPALGGAWWRPPGRPLLRVVRILLECILVLWIFARAFYVFIFKPLKRDDSNQSNQSEKVLQNICLRLSERSALDWRFGNHYINLWFVIKGFYIRR